MHKEKEALDPVVSESILKQCNFLNPDARSNSSREIDYEEEERKEKCNAVQE